MDFNRLCNQFKERPWLPVPYGYGVILVVVSILLGACGSTVRAAESTKTLTPTSTSTPEPTLTLSPVPTAEPIKVDEHDITRVSVDTVEGVYMGVLIKANLIVDKSLDPVIRDARVTNDALYLEFVARTFFKVWWLKGPETHTGMVANEQEFRSFMELWATAQKTCDPLDWAKVQLSKIWANDLNDGNGYTQQFYDMLPMDRCEGTGIEGARSFDTFTIVFVKGSKVVNITMFNGNANERGYGTNLEGEEMLIYCTALSHLLEDATLNIITRAADWLIDNRINAQPRYSDSLPQQNFRELVYASVSVR